MITFVFTYRNRELRTVKNCLNSLAAQSVTDFRVTLVDYGSSVSYSEKIKHLCDDYPFVTSLYVPAVNQLWNKCRAINIALKQCETPYFFVGDVDMIFHQDFVRILIGIAKKDVITYFQVGFLSEEESGKDKKFQDYQVSFTSSEEATGMTFFKTEDLRSINGFDEFYHGWGGEDTDVHVRLKNAGFRVRFYDQRILLLHQWHPKLYRAKNDKTPFHSTLEQINSAYLNLAMQTGTEKANLNFDWGINDAAAFEALESIDETYEITNKEAECKAFIAGVLLTKKNCVVKLLVKRHKEFRSLKQTTKSLIGKKAIEFMEMQMLNNSILEIIIFNLRNAAYAYQYDPEKQSISLVIKL